MEKLNARQVATISEPGRYADGNGLYLQCTKVGKKITKSWLLRYMRDGRARAMGLGPLHTIGLAAARERALEARRVLLDGHDPIDARKERRMANKAKAAKQISFQVCAERFLRGHESSWRNAKHRAQWESTLEAYAYPQIGDLAVAQIETAHILKILEPIWNEKAETASRVQQRIKRVLDWATAREYRQGPNPAAWAGHLDKLLPAQKKSARVRHHPALPWKDVPRFVRELRKRKGVSPLALEFLLLTAARTGEVINAQWPEISLKTKAWEIPGERTKNGKPHRVPLGKRALQILKTVPREKGNDFVFIGGKAGKPMSGMALLELMRDMRPGYVPHGLRSSFRDWAGDRTNHPREVVEQALAHTVGDATERAYRRSDVLERRRKLMNDWAKFCST